MAKKKRLPKDFETLLAKNNLPALQAVFNECDVNARGGYAKQTALAFDACPDELARWLIAHGADLSAADTWGNTPLHARARSRKASINVLLELGADVHADGASIGTPLHAAADTKQVEHAAQLIAHGADLEARNREGLTPLELALRGCSNIEIEEMAKLAQLLLEAGARRTPAMSKYVEEISRRFEFHRAGFANDHVDAASTALETLYKLFDVTPVARRQMHDRASAIVVSATRWQTQHAELWDLLVPSSGPAATVQGEVIRISGRIAHEVEDNGALNWDGDFRKMARAFLAHIQTGASLAEPELADARSIVDSLVRNGSGDSARMAELAVTWVLRNPKPVLLAKPDYHR